MYRWVLVFIAFVSAGSAAAQPKTLQGFVRDTFGRAVEAATVSLLNASDSSWVASALTDQKGTFSFTDLKEQPYLLGITAVGYQQQLQPVTGFSDITITLAKATAALQEVVVKSNAPTIQTSLGKTIVNFEQANAAAGSNVLDLLRRSPGVTVTGNGAVSMNGKGVLILVNDKQTYLAGDDQITYLKSLPAAEVAQLELMNQPSARYDAAGNAGIINIKIRRNKKAGFNGNIASSYGKTRYWNTHHHANLNYKKDKLSLIANLGYLHATSFLDQEINTTVRNTGTNELRSQSAQHGFLKETFEDYSLNTEAAYSLNPEITLGASLQGNYHPNREKDLSESTLTDLQNGSVVINQAENNHGFRRQRAHGGFFADYKHKKQELHFDADYIYWQQKARQNLASKNYDAYLLPLSGDLFLISNNPFYTGVFAAKADYSVALKNELKLEAGAKSSLLTNDTKTVNYLFQSNAWMYDTTTSNHYTYQENIHAAYLNLAKEFSEKWQAQLGLRAEQTHIKGTQEVKNQTFEKSFVSLFPTLFVGYKLNDKNSFELNAGRRIERPSYKDLNPFVRYYSQYNYTSGNPDLLPMFRNNVALKHNYRNMLFSEVSYSKVTNVINPVIVYHAATQEFYETLQNYANKQNVHFSASFQKEIKPWWNVSSAYDWYFNEYRDNAGNFLIASQGHSVSVSNEFNFKGWNVFAFYAYSSGDLQDVTERSGESHWMNATIAKKMWKDTAVIKLSVDDPFNIYRYTPKRNWNGISSDAVMEYATQGVSLEFTYNFGEKLNIERHEQKMEETQRM